MSHVPPSSSLSFPLLFPSLRPSLTQERPWRPFWSMCRPLNPRWSRLQGEPVFQPSMISSPREMPTVWRAEDRYCLSTATISCLRAVPKYSQRSQQRDRHLPARMAHVESLFPFGFMITTYTLTFSAVIQAVTCSGICYYKGEAKRKRKRKKIIIFVTAESEKRPLWFVCFRLLVKRIPNMAESLTDCKYVLVLNLLMLACCTICALYWSTFKKLKLFEAKYITYKYMMQLCKLLTWACSADAWLLL